MATSGVMTPADYIKHHLQSLTSLSDVTEGQDLRNIADFSYINLDAVFFAVVLVFWVATYCGAVPKLPPLACLDVFRLP